MAYVSITVEGGLFPSDLLDRIGTGDLEGQREADFSLDGGRLSDEIQSAFSDMRAYWDAFQRRLQHSGESRTTITRESWMIPLLERLGYKDRGNTIVLWRPAPQIDGVTYAISHRAGEAEDAPPIHVVSIEQPLDRKGGGGGRNPHATVQQFLNRAPTLWGIVTDGKMLRLLRDTQLVSRPTYLEFDLQAMVEGNLYSEFVLLYRLLQRTRLPADGANPNECLLETYYQQGLDEGGRVREHLREGVEAALGELGTALLEHPGSDALRDALRTGALDAEEYYRQLLRLIYRMLFLMVVEERKLLFLPDAEHAGRQHIYGELYSIGRLRERAEHRFAGDRYSDLWEGLRQTFLLFREDDLARPLGLAALNGELFGPNACRDVEDAACENRRLLSAVYRLSTFLDGKVRRRVNYAGLDVEELGSVYESLLDLHPRITPLTPRPPLPRRGEGERANPVGAGLVPVRSDAAPLESGETTGTLSSRDVDLSSAIPTFELVAGSERKQTGSYYTPPQLVRELIESALVPVIEDRLKAAHSQEEKEAALLDLRVVDPASGSGHFLLAAARRIARELGKVRSGDDEPAPEVYRSALRDVIRSCIYAVDKNPLAVDLCKVALWIEGYSAGLPLSFLDNHIKWGDSLVGVADLKVLTGGIPDEAYAPVTGDDRKVAAAFKRQNRDEKKRSASQPTLWETPAVSDVRTLASEFRALGLAEERTPYEVHEKERRYRELRSAGSNWWRDKVACDLWTAAFFLPMTAETGEDDIPTSGKLWRYLETESLHGKLIGDSAELSLKHPFFHWPLEFPDVFARGGFHVVLGNPPWERIKLQEEEFFAARDREIAEAPNKAARDRLIKLLPERDATLGAEFEEAKHQAEAQSKFVRASGRFPLCGRGDVNTYSIFSELNRIVLNGRGRVGCIVPTGIATDSTTRVFFEELMRTHSLVSLWGFENESFIFPGVHHAIRFCLLTTAGSDVPEHSADVVYYLRTVEQINDRRRHFSLSSSDTALLNPNTRTCPIFRTGRDAEINKGIYRRVPVLAADAPQGSESWNVYYMRLVHLADHARHLRFPWEDDDPEWSEPLYEAKLFTTYDHRFATFHGCSREDCAAGRAREVGKSEKADATFAAAPRYFLPRAFVRELFSKYPEYTRPWLLVWRDVTSSTNERTCIAAAIPRGAASVKCPAIGFQPTEPGALMLANLNSLVLDYTARQKVGGMSLAYGVLKQLPVLRPSIYGQLAPWSLDNVLADWVLQRVLELTYTAWDMQPFARDLGYDGPPFPWDDERRFRLRCELDAAFFHLYGIDRDDVGYILETFPIVKRKDVAKYGEYRTKRVILEIYDAMQRAIGTGIPYEGHLAQPAGAVVGGAT